MTERLGDAARMKPLEKVVTITRMRDGSVRAHVGATEIFVLRYNEDLSANDHTVMLVIPGGCVEFKAEGDA